VDQPIMSRIVLTYEDFVALPDDGKRYELHEGELSVTPAPGRRHQQILLKLALIMAPYIESRRLGELYVAPFDCIMTNITVVEPDLVYIDAERQRLLRERGLEGAPTLAVEIISPYTGRIDRRRKMDLYARHDVTWYWIVDPDPRTIEAYHLEAGAYRLEARLDGPAPVELLPFPDLLLDPAAIWP
jgi:Uma2 family endonuclease